MAYQSFKELIVWQKSMELAEQVYELVQKLPNDEKYVLSDQMRRAAISIPSNIAEGHSRSSKSEYLHFLSIARGSLSELETQIILAQRINYLDKSQTEKALNLCDEIQKMLSAMINRL
ncbi:MAG: four helix bundle protein [Eubacterium sp.]|nr:four helix bundle protein [Eubacterium sp.]